MVKGLLVVREKSNDGAAGLDNPYPFSERLDRIGDMFQAVGGKDEIVRSRGNPTKVGGLGDEMEAPRFPGMI